MTKLLRAAVDRGVTFFDTVPDVAADQADASSHCKVSRQKVLDDRRKRREERWSSREQVLIHQMQYAVVYR
jgi:hypothetical protein